MGLVRIRRRHLLTKKKKKNLESLNSSPTINMRLLLKVPKLSSYPSTTCHFSLGPCMLLTFVLCYYLNLYRASSTYALNFSYCVCLVNIK
jgi:hypothetical protein